MICPRCQSDDTMRMSNGRGLCFACKCDWDPNNLSALPAPEPTPAPIPIPIIEPEPLDLPPAALEPFAMATVEEVFGPPLYTEERAQADLAQANTEAVITDADTGQASAGFDVTDLIGQLAHLEGGQVAMVTDIPDDDHVACVTASGVELLVPFEAVEKIVPLGAEPPINVQDVPGNQTGDAHA